MSGLADLLADVAVEAKVYGDPDRAARVLRRRRRAGRLTPLVLAAVVAVAVPVIYVAVHRGPVQMKPSGIVSWLPSRLVPVADPPPLPRDRAVGLGSVVFFGADPGRAVLLTADLAEYSLPTPNPVVSLSPDGRWLLSVVEGHVVLRELTGTATLDLHQLPDGSPPNVAWSADSRTLIVQRPTRDGVTSVVDLDSLASRVIGIPMSMRLCGAQDAGKLLGCSVAGAPVSVTPLDALTGARGSTVAAGLWSAMTLAEQQATLIVAPLTGTVMVPVSGGEVLAVRTNVYHPGVGVTTPGDLLLFDVATGQFLRRIALPPTEVGPRNGGGGFLATEGWDVQAGLPEGIPVFHTAPIGAEQPYDSKVVGVEFADPSTGARVEVMTVAGTVTRMFLRGGTYP